jgi:hypothetical protein
MVLFYLILFPDFILVYVRSIMLFKCAMNNVQKTFETKQNFT